MYVSMDVCRKSLTTATPTPRSAPSSFGCCHPLLTYWRERKVVDLSALKLTAYTIKSIGDPTDEGGSGEVQDKAKIARPS